jgi:hypothetical protein
MSNPMKTRDPQALPLLNWVRPLDSDGPLHSVLLSTYGLGLDQPPFFDQDFLPTLLGLGGVRDRGYSSPANIERRLGQIYCGLVCDAHALAQGGRPSLRVDVIPIGRQLNHAKVVLIHRERLVRLVIASANLTHEGFRRNREAAVVLDFCEGSELPPSLLLDFSQQWLALLGPSATTDFQRALNEAVNAAQVWQPPRSVDAVTVRLLWGGASTPLWRQVVEAWPHGEPLREWLICSPFWPDPAETDTPFDVIQRELDERGANVAAAGMKVFAPADTPGPSGRPVFPFSLVAHLEKRGFRPSDATICPTRLDALASELPDGKAEAQHPPHAKWMLFRSDHTALLLLGSANFTRKGLGVLREPTHANIEVGVLLTGPSSAISLEEILPPVAGEGIVNWGDCRSEHFSPPIPEFEPVSWPDFICGIELEVRWETVPVVGLLHVRIFDDVATPFEIGWESGDEEKRLRLNETSADGTRSVELLAEQVSALLVRRRVVVRWGDPSQQAIFPINIHGDSKPGLPAVLGQSPTEQDLLAYFHGRIDEDDLMNLLIERARQAESENPPPPPAPPGRELQNYVMREFLEGLYGMEEMLLASTCSQRVFEQALLGEFSPVRLANETVKAFVNHRRTATAVGFQLVQLLQLVENLSPRTAEPSKKNIPRWFEKTRERSLAQLMRAVLSAAVRTDFRESCNAEPFRQLVTAVLSDKTAKCWWNAIQLPLETKNL